MPFQPILPTWLALNACNDTSASGMTDPRTGNPYNAGGLNLGDYFDLTEAEANQASYINSTGNQVQLHAGRYRRVLVDSGATAANVKTGTIGVMSASIAPLSFNVVTSADISTTNYPLHPVVFLNVVTPGNYCFVQELGLATVLGAASVATKTVGAVALTTSNGTVDATTTYSNQSIGYLAENAQNSKLFKIVLDLPVVQG